MDRSWTQDWKYPGPAGSPAMKHLPCWSVLALENATGKSFTENTTIRMHCALQGCTIKAKLHLNFHFKLMNRRIEIVK